MYCHKKASCGCSHGGRRNVLPEESLPGIPPEGRAASLLRAWLKCNGDSLQRQSGELEAAVGAILWIHPNCPSDASLQVDAIMVRLDCIRGLLDLGRGWELQP